MDAILSRTIGYLVIAIMVAIAARRLRLPYTVGLVAAGVALALGAPLGGHFFTRDFIFDILLPPLLFEAALNLEWDELRRDAAPILALSIVGTVISTCVIGFGMAAALGWPFPIALLFGSLIAATDPVAVIALFKDLGLTGRTRLLVESESLFNDGVAFVIFSILLSIVSGEMALEVSKIGATLALSVGGGVLAGLICGGAAMLLAGRSSDPLIETALTTVAAYGSFLVAEQYHASGVLAVVSAGLLMGNVGILRHRARPFISEKGREFVLAFWDFAAFIANSLIFLGIGFSVSALTLDLHNITAIAISVAIVLIARAITVYPLCLAFTATTRRIAPGTQHVLWWGGLRGALALALTLSLPNDLPMRGDLVIAGFGVVVFSVIVQGVTMPLMLAALGLARAKT